LPRWIALTSGLLIHTSTEAQIRHHIARWRDLLTSREHVQDARAALREVLAGPIRFTPDAQTYRFEGEKLSIGR